MRIDRSALAVGINTGYLTISPLHYGLPQRIMVVATGQALHVTPFSHDFGSIRVGTATGRTFNVQNRGSTAISGTASVPIPFSAGAGASYDLLVGGNQDVVVRYAPGVSGIHRRTVTFTGGGGAQCEVTGLGYTDSSDSDGDGMLDWAELLAGTRPDDNQSCFRVFLPVPGAQPVPGGGLVLSWPSAPSRLYCLERSPALSSAFTPRAAGLPATPPMNTYTDRTADGNAPYYYRVKVRRE